MKVILMRHGQASYESEHDSERQLTEFGEQQAAETAEYLLKKYSPDVFVVSPYDRAQQTLAAFTKQKPDVPVIVRDTITPDDNAMTGLKSLIDIEGECVLVVCHMPIVAKMAGLLCAQDPESYALAEARVFEAELIAPDMGDEVERYVPKQP